MASNKAKRLPAAKASRGSNKAQFNSGAAWLKTDIKAIIKPQLKGATKRGK